MTTLRYLHFDLSEGSDGVTTLDAMASTRPDQHPAVLAEVAAVRAWCRREFPHSQGPVDEGGDWDEDVQTTQEPGGWHTVTLTLSGSARFVAAFCQAFPAGAD